MAGVAKQTVRFDGLVGGLPKVLAVVVLQLAQNASVWSLVRKDAFLR